MRSADLVAVQVARIGAGALANVTVHAQLLAPASVRHDAHAGDASGPSAYSGHSRNYLEAYPMYIGVGAVVLIIVIILIVLLIRR